MASTAADIIASAKAEAEAARQSAIASLSGLGNELTSAYNTQQAATSAQYQNQLNQLQNAYNTNAKQAYGNYLENRQNLANQMERLGLTDTGYGVTQSILAQSGYSKNLAGLQNAYQTNQANVGVAEQQALADLYSNYAKNKVNLDQYLYEAGQNAYNTAYANSYKAQQDAIANALQQQYYSYLMGSRTSSGGGGGSYSSGGSSRGSSTKQETSLNQGGTVQTQKTGSGSSSTSIKVTDAGKKMASQLSFMVKQMKDKTTAKKEIQSAYNKGQITMGDVNYIIKQLGL